MTQSEMKKRYKAWENISDKQILDYLEDWEQWHHSIAHFDKELYIAIKELRQELGIDKKTNSIGLDFLFE